ncbi:N-acetylmuramoyl-L-alanine amidase [Paenibacillus thalictri]|uniref:N-acetylmuramoyl-L-alanine amidase n=1 Tax=Paenibacillus thalictri TaxID=2527873 RepID=A0A4Q9DR47_9BACL|nr:N-acetylmuramoyl-L-alanine amidase [Paenibacillus thalictri]
MLAVVLLICALPAEPASANEQHEQRICLDPGHQLYGNNALEPVAPDAKEKKAKVTSGTRGVSTKKPEYVLTLETSLLLKDKLETYGYKVIMTRDTHDVDISNIERALVCNEAQADLAVRIHADGDNSPKAQGISLLYPAAVQGAWAPSLPSKAAAELILREAVAASGAVSRGVVPRSDLTGFNWSTVPSVLVEMGFMTNPEEDRRLSDPEYQNKLMEGIATGINLALSVAADEPEQETSTRVFLPSSTQLYEYNNGKMTRTQVALSPQIVKLSAVRGNWGKVNTWIGERWIPLGSSLSPVNAVERQIQLADNTPLYRSPYDSEPAARLSSQTVTAHEQWHEWYLIDTWLGEVWVLNH